MPEAGPRLAAIKTNIELELRRQDKETDQKTAKCFIANRMPAPSKTGPLAI
jgi:hypothetical protein